MNAASNDVFRALPALPEGRFAVAVSGGVDSLCALWEIVQAGCDVIAIHALFHGSEKEDATAITGLRENCRTLGVPFYLLDLKIPFRQSVIRAFADAYRRGETPNPCAICNRTMKFGILLDEAKKLGCNRLVTGHYCALSRGPLPATDAFPLLALASDQKKDQSYFLSLVPRERLAESCFPLFARTKDMTVGIIRASGLSVPLPHESQDVCFIPREPEHYRRFLSSLWEERGEALPENGPILLADVEGHALREIGRHQGLWRYTEGQRQGLGIAWTEPLYVTGKRMADNALLVGTKKSAIMMGVQIGDLNPMVDPDELPDILWARLRYRQKPEAVRIAKKGRDTLTLTLEHGQTLSAPGQIAALYDEYGRILLGGIIRRVLLSGQDGND